MAYSGTVKEKEQRKQYRLKNKEALKLYFIKYRAEHSKERRDYNKNYYLLHKDAHKAWQKQYNLKNSTALKASSRRYYLEHKTEKKIYCSKYRTLKYSSDIFYKLKHDIKARIKITLLNVGKSKSWQKWEKLVGYSAKEMKVHLEKQFTSQMNWENMGKYWEIDHIVPISWFRTPEQVLKHAWALRNLQPLEKELNREKSNAYAGNPKTGIDVIYL